jgi:hypothetical protein
MSVKKSKSKYIFALKGIDVLKIMSKYGINVSSNIQSISHIHPDNTTDLTSLRESNSFFKQNEPEKFSFLDEAKRLRSCTQSQVDYENGKRWCWWCKHQFDTPPWGCPIRLKSSIKNVNYLSAISKTNYSLVEKHELNNNNECVYITDGMFCSINCCLSWANDKKQDVDYTNSLFLLSKMYRQVSRKKITDTVNLPTAAPDWKLLERFGGYLTIHQFREDFDKIEYLKAGTTIHSEPVNVQFAPISHCFEEKLKF